MIKEEAIAILTAKIHAMVEESGGPENFDAAAWLLKWLEQPVPALNWQKPMDVLDKNDGLEVLSTLIAKMQSGAFT